MPHFIIEYPQHLFTDQQTTDLINSIHEAAKTTGLFDEAHIKTRAHPVAFYRVGNDQGSFIHAQLRIHSGRTEAQKKELSNTVLHAIHEFTNQAFTKNISVITVEVVDMDKSAYAKISPKPSC
jgi:5-carboxymethyl-2-hydroxymuconate isomerase